MTAREAAELINQLLLCDRRPVEAVLSFRVPAGEGLAAHPACVTQRGTGEKKLLSVLELLNAVVEGTDRVVLIWDDRRRHILKADALPRDFG